jgi:signal peptidase II
MTGGGSQQGHTTRTYLFIIAAVIVLLDRLAKWTIVNRLPMYDSVIVIPGFFHLTHTENPGAAFDILRYSTAPWKQPLLISLSLLAMVIVAAILWKNSHSLRPTNIGLALILGGAIGNLWDRIFNHRVVDFLDFFLRSYHWPVFNIADSAIVTGAMLLVVEILSTKSRENVESLSR